MLATPCIRSSPFQINGFFLHSPAPPLLKWKETEKRGTSDTNKNPFLRSTNSNSSPFRCSQQSQEADLQGLCSSSSQRLNPTIICSTLKSCSTLKEVKVVHAVATRSFGSSIIFLQNNLIYSYARFSSLVDAMNLFDKMPERSVVSWTTMLNVYLKFGLEDEAVKLFEELIESNVQANSLTLVCLLKLCARRLDFKLGKQIHASVIKGNWRNLIVDSALLYFYAEFGDLSCASKLFDQMPDRDVVCWTTMVAAYAQHGNENAAISLFSQMQHLGFLPNEFTICSVLKACGELKSLKFGRQLHGAVVKGLFIRDVCIESSLVSMYVKCNKVRDARTVFDMMPKRNTVTWTTMISGYAQNGCGDEAIYLFKTMKSRNFFANNLTIVSLLGACTSIGDLCLGKEVHGQILKNTSQSNTHIGSTLISFYCKCREYDYAARVLEMMPTRDCISWTALISGFASLGHGFKALSFMNDMLREGLNPNPFTYSSALKACAKIEAISYGKWLHASLKKTMTLPNVFVDSALIGMYMGCGYTTDAFRVFISMPERNLVAWKILVLGYAKNGQCHKALKLMYRMQAEGFHVDDFILTTVLSSCGDFSLTLESSSTSCDRSV